GFLRQWKKHVTGAGYRTIEDVVDEARQKTGEKKVNIAGYSFGGLVALAYTMENPDTVSKCITIATPVKGTPTAYPLFSLLGVGIYPATVAQMLPGSRFISAMNSYFQAHNDKFIEKRITFENIRSIHDPLAPSQYTSLKEICPGAWNISEHNLEWKGHVGLLHDKRTCRILADTAAYSDYPTIFAPGFGLGKNSFRLLLESMRKACPEEADKLDRMFMASYDYIKPIKAEKIMAEYGK
ncbi:MAG: alpha/beta hydrolase, partial [Nanoarchaeota archaeon]|nr:alpha/beta hydrolase [Nanoarchaeota archaeon]